MGLLPEQLHKIRGDLTVTQTNMSIFSEMLSELTPGLEHPEDRNMFEQLHATCRTMQTRLVELIDQVDDDKLTADLLEVNDNMNNLFLRYDRFEKNKSQSQARQGAIKKSIPQPRPVSEAPLIDFSSGVSDPPPSFTQVPSLANFQDDDAANLADWIGDKNIDTDGATTQEFDQFLAERAAAGDTPRKEK
eukprot:GFUD01040517.1.p1 GENE.GFUD01040517.1~~GFUD01040517.1.p1  ORF type:complete len:190 (-),score=57.72 GFUD01040517.1:260-829(-)